MSHDCESILLVLEDKESRYLKECRLVSTRSLDQEPVSVDISSLKIRAAKFVKAYFAWNTHIFIFTKKELIVLNTKYNTDQRQHFQIS